MFGDMHAEADKSTQNGMWVCRGGRDALRRSAAPSAQDLGIHIIQIPFGLELVREGPQMLNLDLASMPLHKTAHDGLGPLFPSLPSGPTSPSAKKHKTATQPAYLGSANASAYPCSDPFRLLPAEHREGNLLGGHHVEVSSVLMLICRGQEGKRRDNKKESR